MSECENCYKSANAAVFEEALDMTCPAVGYQRVGVSVPVTVTPFVHKGVTKTKCCGKPVVVSSDKPCPGKKNCVCMFTISQMICVEVPVEFGAMAVVGDTYVDCFEASANDICVYCKDKENDI